ncbi:MAG: SHOCT domain-containing protein, partial [Myxococcaceae bacterium]|nr:SHOCT domain-containing protein [Myxococcaceae bacterium]
IKEEDEATLKKFSKDAAYSRMAGGFQQYAQGQAMLGASEGMAKGGGGSDGALSGMGMGMGMGMAQMFMNQQNPQRQAPPPAAEAPPADTRSPAQRLKELKELLDAGVLSEEEYKAKRAELMKLL